MNPFFFGDSDRPLFGVYHPPRGPVDLRHGIVMCAPLGQEYMRSHRAFRTLANLLSRRGLHVFRFDYFGTGDSSGDSDAGSPRVWERDVDQALEELRANGSLERVSLLGLRFGAALALRAASRRDDIDQLVLWDPVLRGSAYVDEMLRVADPAEDGAAGRVGVLGFPLTAEMREQIGRIDSTGSELPTRVVASIFVSSEDPCARAWARAIVERGGRASYRCVPSAGNWNEVDNFGGALVPQEIIQAVVEHLTQAGQGSGRPDSAESGKGRAR